MNTVVGLFATVAEAERVATGLNELGIPDSDINIVAGNEKNQHDVGSKDTHAEAGGTAAAAGSGAAIGGGVGLVAGLVALAIPGIGPVIAGGALATALTGLGVGAAAGGLIGAFADMGVPEHDASVYQEAVRRGGVVVSAKVNDTMAGEVMRLMDRHGARDVNAESDVWRASGWAGPTLGGMVYDPAMQPFGYMPADTMQPVMTENPTYKSRARSYSPGTNTQASEPRFSMNHEKTDETPAREKTSPLGLSDIPADSGTEHFPVRTKPHHLSQDPAWIFGNRWASDPNYAGKGWSDVESNVRSSWESAHAGSWDTFRDKVRIGFETSNDETEPDPLSTVDLSSRSGQRGY